MTQTDNTTNDHKETGTMDTTEPTQLIEIPCTWWSNFTSEAICDDADGYTEGPDDTLIRINRLLAKPITSRTKRVVRIELEHDLICELASQADWYAYHWGEELASGAWDLGERGAWQSKGRASATFERKLRQIIAAAVA